MRIHLAHRSKKSITRSDSSAKRWFTNTFDFAAKHNKLINIKKQPVSGAFHRTSDTKNDIKRQAKEIADLKAQLEQQANLPSDRALDDDILNYDEIKAIQAIKNEFWLDYDPKNKPVLKLVVTEWITQNYPSINPSMASWLDKIVRQKYVK